MSKSSNRKELFRTPTTKDKLKLFQNLFDSQLLTADVSLALLNLIHRDLSADKEYDRSLYKHYARLIAMQHHYMFDVHQQVVEAWRRKQTALKA